MDGEVLTPDVTLTVDSKVEKWAEIRRNDPNVTSGVFYNDDDGHIERRPRDGTCVWLHGTEALRGNTHVTKLCFNFHGRVEKNFAWEAALHVIQNRPALAALDLRGVPARRACAGLCDRLVLAASRNSSVRAIRLDYSHFSAESLLLLLAGTGTPAMTLRSLHLSRNTIHSSLLESAPPATHSSLESSIENAAQDNTTLTDLTLVPSTKTRDAGIQYLICLLNGLARSVHSKLQTLRLVASTPSVDMSRAIRGLLQSTTAATKLRTLRLEGCPFTAATLQPLARGLSRSAPAVTLTLRRCSFDEEATGLLQAAVCASSASLRSLSVDRYSIFPHGRAMDVVTHALGPSSQLERLELSLHNKIEEDVAVIMQLVGRSPMLKILRLTDLLFPGDDPDDLFGNHCNAFAACLPGLGTLQSLRFTMAQDLDNMWYPDSEEDAFARSRLVEAVRKSSSLLDVVGLRHDEDELFGTAERAQLARYAERNKALSRLFDSNRSLSVQLLLRLAKTVRRCVHRPGWTVRILLALEQPLSRKRRRPEA